MPGKNTTSFMHELRASFDRGGAVCIACGTANVTPRLLRNSAAMLCGPENERLESMRNTAKRAEFLLSRLALKSAAHALFGGEPRGMSLFRDAGGAYILEGTGEPGIHVSISHCHGAIALMFARETRAGTDIEQEARVTRAIARRFFSAREFDEITRGANPDSEFTVRWTLKEAYAKACGAPLLRALLEAEFILEEGRYRLRESVSGIDAGWIFLSAGVQGRFRLAAARSGGGVTGVVDCGEVSLLAGLIR
jgi:4'-phosphopantetheinyl transferase